MADQENGSTVREMSAEERNSYGGVTIDAHMNSSDARRHTQGHQFHRYTCGRSGFHLSFGPLLSVRYNVWMKLAFYIGAVAIVAFLFVVVLPAVIVLLGVGVAIYLVLQWLR